VSDKSKSASRNSDEAMHDSVRGVLQVIRNKPGATFKDVRVHCSLRGDDLSKWPLWIADADGYVTEASAARMLYEIMQANAPRSELRTPSTVDADVMARIVGCSTLDEVRAVLDAHGWAVAQKRAADWNRFMDKLQQPNERPD
jgi:hypothetical protein